MNVKEMLNLADKIVFEKTGQHLDDLQEAVLRGTLQRETYKQIATDFDCSESSVRKVGSQLWEILSEELGEDISKSNFRSAMQRLQNYSVLNFAKVTQNLSGNFNVCEGSRHPPDIPNSHPPNQEKTNTNQTKILHQDLSEMPDLGAFYDSPSGDSFASRTSELTTLTTWILQQRCRLIALTGISGIGKTALAAQLVQQIKDEFEYVIWCNLDESYTLDELQHKLIQFFSQSENLNSPATNQKPLPLIKYLQKSRCLVVLDDIQNLFISGELAGKYKPGYEEYRTFFKQIKTLSHQSCFVIIGLEPREFSQIESENNSIRTLQITGLDIATGVQIFRDKGLKETHKYSALIHLYQGNPLWLKSVATLIKELGGCVTELLPNNTILLPEDLKDILEEQFDRLSKIEKQVISLLAKESEPVNLAKLLENSLIPASDLVNSLQSLSRRCLIEQQGNYYTLPTVLKEYITQVASKGT